MIDILPLDEDGELAVDHPMKETSYYTQAMEDIMLLNEAGNDFDEDKIQNGELTPVFFGSALTNFGVQTFLETYLQFAPAPQPRITEDEQEVNPVDRRIFWIYIQNSSKYESCASRPYCFCANCFR